MAAFLPVPAEPAPSPRFLTTRWSLVSSLRHEPDEARRDAVLAQLCRAYWFPLYGYARRSGQPPHDAEDFTQAFFMRALRNDLFAKANREQGRMRTFLLTAFQRFMRDEFEKNTAAKRGGRERTLSLDAMEAEQRYQCEPHDIATPEDLYNRRWARDFFATVKERLRREFATEGKAAVFAVLGSWLPPGGSEGDHAAAAAELGVTDGNFRVLLQRFRKRYRALFKEAVADTLESPDEEEVNAEIRELIRFGA